MKIKLIINYMLISCFIFLIWLLTFYCEPSYRAEHLIEIFKSSELKQSKAESLFGEGWDSLCAIPGDAVGTNVNKVLDRKLNITEYFLWIKYGTENQEDMNILLFLKNGELVQIEMISKSYFYTSYGCYDYNKLYLIKEANGTIGVFTK